MYRQKIPHFLTRRYANTLLRLYIYAMRAYDAKTSVPPEKCV